MRSSLDDLQLHEEDGVFPVLETTREVNEHDSLPGLECGALHLARGNDQLLSERRMLDATFIRAAKEILDKICHQWSRAQRLENAVANPTYGMPERSPNAGSDDAQRSSEPNPTHGNL